MVIPEICWDVLILRGIAEEPWLSLLYVATKESQCAKSSLVSVVSFRDSTLYSRKCYVMRSLVQFLLALLVQFRGALLDDIS